MSQKAAAEFMKAISFLLDKPGHAITVTIDDASLKTCDDDAFVDWLIETMDTHGSEID
jgi:hypothetical protein